MFHFNKKTRKPNKFVPCKCAGEVGHLEKRRFQLRSAQHGRKTRAESLDSLKWTHEGKPTQGFRAPELVIRIGRQVGPMGKDIDHSDSRLASGKFGLRKWSQNMLMWP